MTRERIRNLLRKGEGLTIEFKRCAGKIEHDVFESICAFLNRFGGDVLLGVENDGTVVGVKGDAVALRNNIVNVANDENVFDPVVYIDPEIADPQLLDGDVFLIEVSLKSLEVAPISPEVAPKNPKVAPINLEVAPISSEVAQRSAEITQRIERVVKKLDGHGRADAVENAAVVYKCIIEDNRIAIPDIESKTHLSNGSVKNAIRLLRINEIIVRRGSNRSGKWEALV